MLDLVNVLDASMTDCGGVSIPDQIINILHSLILVIQIGIPIILVVLGMLDMGKAVMSQKEDEIKKNQSLLIKRVIYAIVVFLVVSIVQFVINLVAPASKDGILACIDAIMSGK